MEFIAIHLTSIFFVVFSCIFFIFVLFLIIFSKRKKSIKLFYLLNFRLFLFDFGKLFGIKHLGPLPIKSNLFAIIKAFLTRS